MVRDIICNISHSYTNETSLKFLDQWKRIISIFFPVLLISSVRHFYFLTFLPFLFFFSWHSLIMWPWLAWNSLCRPSWLHRDLPASASRILGLKECAAMLGLTGFYWTFIQSLRSSTLRRTDSRRSCVISEAPSLSAKDTRHTKVLPYPHPSSPVHDPHFNLSITL